MPRLRNRGTGVVVNVESDLAARLSGEWEPAGKTPPLAARDEPQPEPEKPVPARKRPARRKSSKN